MLANLHHLIRLGLRYLLPPSKLDAKQKVIVTYRYISWFITSLFYLTGPPYSTFVYKLMVVVALFVFSRILMDYYLKNSSIQTIPYTALVENIGLALLLVPTGGLESPFIWYALNPILIASSYLVGIYCWVNLTFYLLTSLIISFKLFNSHGLAVTELIQDKSYIILVFILITIAIRLIVSMVKQLDRQAEELEEQKQELMNMNKKLNEANESVNRSMEYVMSLYHIIETFSSREEPYALLAQMVNSTMKIMDCQSAFIWLAPYKDDNSELIAQNLTETQEIRLLKYLEGLVTMNTGKKQFTYQLDETTYSLTHVQTTSRLYGYMGIAVTTENLGNCHDINHELFNLIGELVAYILERKQLEQMSANLAILEEQNRIGNEIHDSVSQRLFSIICGLHALNSNLHRLDPESISRQLLLIEQSAKETSKELRTSIYSLSLCKKGEAVFRRDLENYLMDFESLNGIKVSFEFLGEEGRISFPLKHAVYRIVKEATGNAVRHGKCRELKVQLIVQISTLELLIKDNGQGFDTEYVLQNRDNRGLGLNNMQLLTQSFNGLFELLSNEKCGTEIRIKIPLSNISDLQVKRQGGVA